MTEMAMQRHRDGKRRAPRENVTERTTGNRWVRPQRRKREKESEREGHGQKQREADRETHRDGRQGGCGAGRGGRRERLSPSPAGR